MRAVCKWFNMLRTTADKKDSRTGHRAVNTTLHRFTDAENLSAWVRDFKSDAGTIVAGASRPLPAAAPTQAQFADIGGLQSIIEYTKSDQVVSVQCGITCGALQAQLAANHHWLPVTAAANQTLLDVITSGDAGELTHGFGGPRDLVLGLTVVLADGRTIKSGGKVVKNVTGYDTTKLFVGSHGWFGIPVAAHLRLYALPETARTLLFSFPHVDAAFAAAKSVLALGLPLSCCEIFSAAALSRKKLPPDIVPQGMCHLALLIHGHAQVVAEIAGAAHNAAGVTPASDSPFWEKLWSADGDIQAVETSDDRAIEITLPMQTMRKLLSQPDFSTLTWQARPLRGSLRLYSVFAQVESTVAKIKSAVARDRMPASIAYPTDKHWLQVERIPEKDTAVDLLKEELKKRFDPEHKFNRLVRL